MENNDMENKNMEDNNTDNNNTENNVIEFLDVELNDTEVSDTEADEFPFNECRQIRQDLERNPKLKWGFIIYRCTYGDDEAWETFMKHLNTRVRLNLMEERNEDLFDRIDWCVQEDPALEAASDRDVRARFEKWISEGHEKDDWMGTPRFSACVKVAKCHVEDTLDGPPPEEFDVDGEGYVALISRDEEEDMTFVGLSYLVPNIFHLLENDGWHTFATNPDIDHVAGPVQFDHEALERLVPFEED